MSSSHANQMSAGSNGPPSPPGLPPPIASPDPERPCPICRNALGSTYHEDPVMTYCGHVFGAACLFAWSATHPTCPRLRCRKPQFHPLCGHRCQPRDFFANTPTLAADPAERRLEPTCVRCWARDAMEEFQLRDPVLRDALAANRARAEELLAVGLFWGEGWVDVVLVDFWARAVRAVRESRGRWEGSAEGRRDRW